MKVLLINPSPTNPAKPNFLVPPLGLAYLAAVLRENGFGVKIIDANALRLTFEELKDLARKEKPDVIGLTGVTTQIDSVFRTAKICRPFSKYLVLGGPHATAFGNEVFSACPELDFLVSGEGEIAFLNLLNSIKKGKRVRRTIIKAPLLKNLDRLPFPARNLLPNHLYRYSIVRRYPFATMITSRGCPFNCLFCDKTIFGHSFRARSAENVLEEIEEVTKRYQAKTIIFFDDLFTFDKERVIKICAGIIKRKIKIEWKAEARVDTIDEEMLKMMKEAGCFVLCFGIESANQKTLDFLEKKTTIKKIKKALEMTKKTGIKALGYFILGVPNETYRRAQKTIDFSLKYCDFAAYNLLTPFPGSKLYPLALKKGWINNDKNLGYFQENTKTPVLVSKYWSQKMLEKIIEEANSKFHLRPQYLLRQASSFISYPQIVTVFKYGLQILKRHLKNKQVII